MTNTLTPIEVLRPVIQAGLESCRNLNLPLLQNVQKMDAFQSAIKWQVNTSTSASVGVAKSAPTPAGSSDVVKGASLEIGEAALIETVEISRNEIVEAANIGTAPLQNLLASHFKAKLEKLMISLEQYMFDGTGAVEDAGIRGLAYVTAAGEYAGINPATYTAWNAIRDTNVTARSLSEELLQKIDLSFKGRGHRYNALLMSPDMSAEFEALFASTGNLTMTPSSELARNFGGSSFSYKGQPVIASPYATDNAIYFVDFSQMSLHTRAATSDVTMKESGLNIQISDIKDTGRVVKYEMSVFPQFQYVNRRASGVITNLSQPVVFVA